MARLVTVYAPSRSELRPEEMGIIRWLRISEAIAGFGHEVHLAAGRVRGPWRWPRKLPGAPSVKLIPLSGLRWHRYDAVKTLFHRGFETLEHFGGMDHPFVISKLGSVVAASDRPGIYFYGERREHLFRTQQRIAETSRYVSLLSEPARTLFRESHGRERGLLLVPGAAESEIPSKGDDPYPHDGRPRCLFLGSFYRATPMSQPEAHRTITDKLNRLGAELGKAGIGLYVVGPGDEQSLDPDCVTYLGTVPYRDSWAFIHHAQVGLVVSAGAFMHNNESTKIYHYLRAGLPVVSESGFPNDNVVDESGLGFRVMPGDLDTLAARIEETVSKDWDRASAVRYILEHHTWERRAATYDEILTASFGEA